MLIAVGKTEIISVVGSLISIVERLSLSLCLDAGCCIGSYAVSVSVLESDVYLELLLRPRSVAVSTS